MKRELRMDFTPIIILLRIMNQMHCFPATAVMWGFHSGPWPAECRSTTLRGRMAGEVFPPSIFNLPGVNCQLLALALLIAQTGNLADKRVPVGPDIESNKH